MWQQIGGIYCMNHNNWLLLPSLWGELLHAHSNSSAWQTGSIHWFMNLQIRECNQLGCLWAWVLFFPFVFILPFLAADISLVKHEQRHNTSHYYGAINYFSECPWKQGMPNCFTGHL